MIEYIDTDGRYTFEDCREPYHNALWLLRWIMRNDLKLARSGKLRKGVAGLLLHIRMYIGTLWSGKGQIVWRRM